MTVSLLKGQPQPMQVVEEQAHIADERTASEQWSKLPESKAAANPGAVPGVG